MVEVRAPEAYELRFTWRHYIGRVQKENLTIIPLHESQYDHARRYIEEHGVKVPLQEGHDKMIIPDDDYLVGGYFFRLNRGNQIESGGGQRRISVFLPDDNRDIGLEKLLESADLPLP